MARLVSSLSRALNGVNVSCGNLFITNSRNSVQIGVAHPEVRRYSQRKTSSKFHTRGC